MRQTKVVHHLNAGCRPFRGHFAARLQEHGFPLRKLATRGAMHGMVPCVIRLWRSYLKNGLRPGHRRLMLVRLQGWSHVPPRRLPRRGAVVRGRGHGGHHHGKISESTREG